MKRLLVALPLCSLAIVVAGCPAEPTAGKGVTSAVTSPSTPPALSAAPASKPRGVAAGEDSASREYPVIAASSCEGRGRAVSPSDAKLELEPTMSRVRTHASWGCGCPKGPVFTMAYVPKTSPLEIRLCLDPAQDSCEMECSQPIVWDLAAPMREAGASAVKLVK